MPFLPKEYENIPPEKKNCLRLTFFAHKKAKKKFILVLHFTSTMRLVDCYWLPFMIGQRREEEKNVRNRDLIIIFWLLFFFLLRGGGDLQVMYGEEMLPFFSVV